MDEGDERDILQIDSEKQANAEHGLDCAGDIHPGGRRLEAGLDEKLEGGRDRDFADDVRNEKEGANDAQDIEFVEQVEFVGKRHGGGPPGGSLHGNPSNAKSHFPLCEPIPGACAYSFRPLSQASPLA
jgi:hypothetical protein